MFQDEDIIAEHIVKYKENIKMDEKLNSLLDGKSLHENEAACDITYELEIEKGKPAILGKMTLIKVSQLSYRHRY